MLLDGCLYRKTCGLLAPEDAIDIALRVAVLVGKISPIGDQTAVGEEDRVQFVSGRISRSLPSLARA
jgi:hypothetical protein